MQLKQLSTAIVCYLLIAISPINNAQQLNHSQQATYIQQQAKSGDAKAQYQLASMHLRGYQVEKDFDLAFKWMKTSAEQGYPAAEFDLASMYDIGEGTDKDLQQAANWYEKVARKGEAAAAFNLASMYESGEGRTQDLVTAYAWFEAAALMGFEDAKTASARLVTQFNAETLKTADQKAAQLINSISKHSQ